MIRTTYAPTSPATLLREFPHGACATDGSTFRVWDGFGNAGRGSTWDEAHESLRLSQCATAARLDALDREEARRRALLAARLRNLAIGAAAVLLLLAGFVRPN